MLMLAGAGAVVQFKYVVDTETADESVDAEKVQHHDVYSSISHDDDDSEYKETGSRR